MSFVRERGSVVGRPRPAYGVVGEVLVGVVEGHDHVVPHAARDHRRAGVRATRARRSGADEHVRRRACRGEGVGDGARCAVLRRLVRVARRITGFGRDRRVGASGVRRRRGGVDGNLGRGRAARAGRDQSDASDVQDDRAASGIDLRPSCRRHRGGSGLPDRHEARRQIEEHELEGLLLRRQGMRRATRGNGAALAVVGFSPMSPASG